MSNLKYKNYWCLEKNIFLIILYSFYFQNHKEESFIKNIKPELKNYSEVFLHKSAEQEYDGRN